MRTLHVLNVVAHSFVNTLRDDVMRRRNLHIHAAHRCIQHTRRCTQLLQPTLPHSAEQTQTRTNTPTCTHGLQRNTHTHQHTHMHTHTEKVLYKSFRCFKPTSRNIILTGAKATCYRTAQTNHHSVAHCVIKWVSFLDYLSILHGKTKNLK